MAKSCFLKSNHDLWRGNTGKILFKTKQDTFKRRLVSEVTCANSSQQHSDCHHLILSSDTDKLWVSGRYNTPATLLPLWHWSALCPSADGVCRPQHSIGSHGQYVPTVSAAADALTRHWWPGDLDIWLLTVKVVSESCVRWATSVPILVFLDLFSLLNLGEPDVRDIQTWDRQTDRQTSDSIIA